MGPGDESGPDRENVKMEKSKFQNAIHDLINECDRQIEKWGAQSHPDGTGDDDAVNALQYVRAECQRAFRENRGTWLHILDEEIYEAFAEIDARKLRTELIQVAAVAISWIVDIDNRA